jgi:hypothetical protein
MRPVQEPESDYPDGPEGLLPLLELDVPQGFERDEWEQLTEVLITFLYNSAC